MTARSGLTASDFRYLGLLASLTLMMLLAPVVETRGVLWLLTQTAFGALLVFAVWTVSHNRRTTAVASLLAAALFVGNGVGTAAMLPAPVETLTMLGGAAFFAYVAIVVLRDVFLSPHVELDTIVGAICGYILLGVFWGFLYGVVAVIDPGAFPARRPAVT